MKARSLKTRQPPTVKPMLATLVKQPFIDADYLFEVKCDGYRTIAYCQGRRRRTSIKGRGKDYTRKYPTVVAALKAIDIDCVLDGDVVYTTRDARYNGSYNTSHGKEGLK